MTKSIRRWENLVTERRHDHDRPASLLIATRDGSPLATAAADRPDGPDLVMVHREDAGMPVSRVGAGLAQPKDQFVRSDPVLVTWLRAPDADPGRIA